MAMDFYAWTGDTQYLPIAFQAGNYLMQHFNNRSAEGRVVIWPAQVLETYWCDYDVGHGYQNCCADDSPTIGGMMTLFEKLLALPPSLTTAAQRAQWKAFQDTLMPALPIAQDIILPARIVSSPAHNNEGPELYAIHPHRVYTKGRQVATGRNISVGVATHLSSKFAKENSGWNYGLNSAALIGLADIAAAQVMMIQHKRIEIDLFFENDQCNTAFSTLLAIAC